MTKTFFYLLVIGYSLCSKAQDVDVRILQQIHTPHVTEADDALHLLTNSTTLVSAGIPVGLLTIGWIRNDSVAIRSAMVVVATYVVSSAVTLSMKYAWNRPRPFEAYPQYFVKKASAGSPSFPSQHTSLVFAAATSLSLQYPRWYIIVPSYLWAGGVAYSRMHLGVHYPSDVLVGALIGSASAYLSYKANRWLHKKYGY